MKDKEYSFVHKYCTKDIKITLKFHAYRVDNYNYNSALKLCFRDVQFSALNYRDILNGVHSTSECYILCNYPECKSSFDPLNVQKEFYSTYHLAYMHIKEVTKKKYVYHNY